MYIQRCAAGCCRRSEFYESRFFISGEGVEIDIQDPLLGSFHLGTKQLFQLKDLVFAIEICEDLWAPLAPSNYHAIAGAHLICNLSASNELVAQQSERLLSAYLYVSSSPMESLKDFVY